jgi:hypothetical protein
VRPEGPTSLSGKTGPENTPEDGPIERVAGAWLLRHEPDGSETGPMHPQVAPPDSFATSGPTRERVRAFVQQGGGCRATFFNYRRRLGAPEPSSEGQGEGPAAGETGENPEG